jgi:hypothetical protein
LDEKTTLDQVVERPGGRLGVTLRAALPDIARQDVRPDIAHVRGNTDRRLDGHRDLTESYIKI